MLFIRRAAGIALLVFGMVAIISLDPIRLVFRVVWNFYATLFGGVFF